MKNISPSSFPNFHGSMSEDPYTFMFEFDVLCKIYDYTTDAHKLKLFTVALKDESLRWFMRLGINVVTMRAQMKEKLLDRYRDYCRPSSKGGDEIYITIQKKDEPLEDYL